MESFFPKEVQFITNFIVIKLNISRWGFIFPSFDGWEMNFQGVRNVKIGLGN